MPVQKSAYNNPARLINKIARLNTRWLEPRLQPLGLAVAQLPVLTILRDGAHSQRDLARLLQVEQPTMAQLLQRMERDGLIQRSPDPKDGRSSLVKLTAMAERNLEPVKRLLEEGRRSLLKGFSKGDLVTLDALLYKLLANLENADSD